MFLARKGMESPWKTISTLARPWKICFLSNRIAWLATEQEFSWIVVFLPEEGKVYNTYEEARDACNVLNAGHPLFEESMAM